MPILAAADLGRLRRVALTFCRRSAPRWAGRSMAEEAARVLVGRRGDACRAPRRVALARLLQRLLQRLAFALPLRSVERRLPC